MQILLFGSDNSITFTVEKMLVSVDDWIVTKVFSISSIKGENGKNSFFDIIIAHLSGFNKTPHDIIREIVSVFPTFPLLAMYSYEHEFLIEPLLEAGATGYLHIDTCEEKLLAAVNKVKDGTIYVDVVNT